MDRAAVDRRLAQRATARATGDWALSDKIRRELSGDGINVVDSPNGQIADGGTEHELRMARSALVSCRAERDRLQRELETLRKREAYDHERIVALQKELLALKHGH